MCNAAISFIFSRAFALNFRTTARLSTSRFKQPDFGDVPTNLDREHRTQALGLHAMGRLSIITGHSFEVVVHTGHGVA